MTDTGDHHKYSAKIILTGTILSPFVFWLLLPLFYDNTDISFYGSIISGLLMIYLLGIFAFLPIWLPFLWFSIFLLKRKPHYKFIKTLHLLLFISLFTLTIFIYNCLGKMNTNLIVTSIATFISTTLFILVFPTRAKKTITDIGT